MKRFVHGSTVTAVFALFACPSHAGVTLIPALVEGDAVKGVGLVTSVATVAINDGGAWLVEADTDNADTDADGVLVRDTGLLLREGDPIDPDGATIGSFDSINLTNGENSAFNFFLDGPPSGEDSGLYWNTTLVLQEGDDVSSLGFSDGTNVLGFFDTKPNDLDNFYVILTVDDPAIASTVDQAIVFYENPGMGFPGLIVAKEGDIPADQTEAIQDFDTGPHNSAINDADQVMFFADLEGDTGTDGVIYVANVTPPLSGGTVTLTNIAQEGDTSPVDGRTYQSLGSSEMDLNDLGGHVFTATLSDDTTTNAIIVYGFGGQDIRNGDKFRQEGDAVMTGSGTWLLTSFGTGPVYLSNSCDVLWYGDWDDPNADEDTGLFLNDTLLIQEGVTLINGVPVDTIRGITDGYHLSADGSYAIVRMVLADGTDGSWIVDLVDPCPWDAEGNLVVGFTDLTTLLANWGPCPDPLCSCDQDFDGDGLVGFTDLTELLANWGPC